MWPVTADWLAALGVSHIRTTRMEAWYAGAKVADVPVESGSVQVTARNRVRRQLSAVVPESFWPANSTDALAPYGAQVKVFQSLLGTGGGVLGPEVPVFAGRVESVSRDRRSGLATVTAMDPAMDVNDAEFETPRAPQVATDIVTNIIGLVSEVRSDAQFQNLTGSQNLMPAGIMWDTDRGRAIDDLAASLGAEVCCLPDGVTWLIRAVPTLAGSPVWTLAQGQGGTMVRDAQSKVRADVANRVVVHVEQPGATPILVVVTDDNPASLTRYGGPYGKVVRHVSNPLITSEGQAQVAGAARLARLIGVTRTRVVDTVPNPALEAGDLISVVTEEGTELHIADSFTVPLAVTDVMTVQTRSTQTSTS